MSIQQAQARVREIEALTQGVSAGAVPATAPVDAATSAAFSQQLQAQQSLVSGLTDTPSADPVMAANALPGSTSLIPQVSAQKLLQLQQQQAAGGGNGALGVQALLAGLQPSTVSGATTASSVGAMPHLTGDTQGLNPELLRRLEQVGQALGQTIEVKSGFRTRAEQEVLYQKYLNGTGNLAARPGQSNHESGNAADVYVNGVALANAPGGRDAAAAAGLGFPVGGEAWHTELR